MSNKRHFAYPRRWGIVHKTAFTIVWMALLAGIFSIAATMAVTQTRAEGNAARELGELLDTVESTVRIACFVEDQALAAEVVRGMLKNSKVRGVTIYAGERELARLDRFSAGPAASAAAEESPAAAAGRRLVRRVASPFDPAQTVGEIALDPDPAAISRSVADDVQFVVVLLGGQWVAIGGGLLLLVMANVVRPIKRISDSLHRMDAEGGERLVPPAGHEGTEIGRLVADINALAARLLAAIGQAVRQAGQLQEAKEQVDAQARQLEAKNAALARAMQVQEEVERIARHDLKTPLNSIAAVPALLRRQRQPGADEEALLSLVENSARRVLRMVSLSLDLFRMEEGNYTCHPKAVDIGALALGVTQELAEEARARGVAFAIAAPRPPAWARAEETLCYSILANLLKNAVEAAPPGSEIRIAVAAGDPVRLSIHNDGAVPLPVRASFFEKYATYGKSRGTGLGTYSARLMARVQGGELTLETSEAAGTTLRLELPPARDLPGEAPAAASPGLPAPPAAEAALLPLRILLADDDPDNMLIMKLLLPSPPLAVETAANGREALAACRRQRPDLVFMDLEMPVMGGFEALKRIRALQAERSEAPSTVVAFSAHDDEASRERSLAAGFDRHLGKPSSQAEILALLRATEGGGAQAAALPEATVWVDADLYDAIPGFLESRRLLVAGLRPALEAGDREALRRLAHKLKGSFGLYGFNWAARICRELEDGFLDADPKSLALQIDALEQHLAHLKIRPRTPVRDLSS